MSNGSYGGKGWQLFKKLIIELYKSTIPQLRYSQRIKNRDSTKYTYMHVNSSTPNNS